MRLDMRFMRSGMRSYRMHRMSDRMPIRMTMRLAKLIVLMGTEETLAVLWLPRGMAIIAVERSIAVEHVVHVVGGATGHAIGHAIHAVGHAVVSHAPHAGPHGGSHDDSHGEANCPHGNRREQKGQRHGHHCDSLRLSMWFMWWGVRPRMRLDM